MTPENVTMLIQFAGVALILWILFGKSFIIFRDPKDIRDPKDKNEKK